MSSPAIPNFDDWSKQQVPNFDEWHPEGEKPKGVGQRFTEGLGQGVTDMGQMIRHPYETVKALLPQSGTVQPGQHVALMEHSPFSPEGRSELRQKAEETPVIGDFLRGNLAGGIGRAIPTLATAALAHEAPVSEVASKAGSLALPIAKGTAAAIPKIPLLPKNLGSLWQPAKAFAGGFRNARDAQAAEAVAGLPVTGPAPIQGLADISGPKATSGGPPTAPPSEPVPATATTKIPSSGLKPIAPVIQPQIRKLLPAGAIRTPPPADTSGVIPGWKPTMLEHEPPPIQPAEPMSQPQPAEGDISPRGNATPLRPPLQMPKREIAPQSLPVTTPNPLSPEGTLGDLREKFGLPRKVSNANYRYDEGSGARGIIRYPQPMDLEEQLRQSLKGGK